jgi:ABC-type bacteriocin/lantibiotic exporter with double-glycine peptidase domain
LNLLSFFLSFELSFFLSFVLSFQLSSFKLSFEHSFFFSLILSVYSMEIHTDLVNHVMRCPSSFFDTTPMGRIINRFSGDMVYINCVYLFI